MTTQTKTAAITKVAANKAASIIASAEAMSPPTPVSVLTICYILTVR